MTQPQTQTEPSRRSSSAEPEYRLQLWDPRLPIPEVAKHWLVMALMGDPRASIADVMAAISEERWQLWAVLCGKQWSAVVVTEIMVWPKMRTLRVLLCGGRKMRDWVHLIEDLEGHARNLGCSMVEVYGRRGWSRVLRGYTERMTLLERGV